MVHLKLKVGKTKRKRRVRILSIFVRRIGSINVSDFSSMQAKDIRQVER